MSVALGAENLAWAGEKTLPATWLDYFTGARQISRTARCLALLNPVSALPAPAKVPFLKPGEVTIFDTSGNPNRKKRPGLTESLTGIAFFQEEGTIFAQMDSPQKGFPFQLGPYRENIVPHLEDFFWSNIAPQLYADMKTRVIRGMTAEISGTGTAEISGAAAKPHLKQLQEFIEKSNQPAPPEPNPFPDPEGLNESSSPFRVRWLKDTTRDRNVTGFEITFRLVKSFPYDLEPLLKGNNTDSTLQPGWYRMRLIVRDGYVINAIQMHGKPTVGVMTERMTSLFGNSLETSPDSTPENPIKRAYCNRDADGWVRNFMNYFNPILKSQSYVIDRFVIEMHNHAAAAGAANSTP